MVSIKYFHVQVFYAGHRVINIYIFLPELEQLFAKFDTDNDGKITFDDVKSFCLKESVQVFGSNPTDKDIKEYCDKMDIDGK